MPLAMVIESGVPWVASVGDCGTENPVRHGTELKMREVFQN